MRYEDGEASLVFCGVPLEMQRPSGMGYGSGEAAGCGYAQGDGYRTDGDAAVRWIESLGVVCGVEIKPDRGGISPPFFLFCSPLNPRFCFFLFCSGRPALEEPSPIWIHILFFLNLLAAGSSLVFFHTIPSTLLQPFDLLGCILGAGTWFDQF